MNKEILMVVDAVSNEKGVEKDIIFEALEAALGVCNAQEVRRRDRRARVDQPQDGDYDTFQRWKVLPTTRPNSSSRTRSCASRTPSTFRRRRNRVATSKCRSSPWRSPHRRADREQVIVQKVREAERAQVVDMYKARIGTLVSGLVKRVDRNGIFVDLAATPKASSRATR